jgi:hypothetical protein
LRKQAGKFTFHVFIDQTLQGRTGERQRNEKKLFPQTQPAPKPGIRRPGTLKTHFFQPQPKKALTYSVFVVFLAPFLIRLE